MNRKPVDGHACGRIPYANTVPGRSGAILSIMVLEYPPIPLILLLSDDLGLSSHPFNPGSNPSFPSWFKPNFPQLA
ncbi:hypothetical protein [Sphingobacterium sp.]|uniref:hypothetical protein n=1 Tax=Sphingobacterium sp. TaxID=341027 RepID=UPI0028AD4B8C|nr:hypothetical protein [Sphingobacterium sp.]